MAETDPTQAPRIDLLPLRFRRPVAVSVGALAALTIPFLAGCSDDSEPYSSVQSSQATAEARPQTYPPILCGGMEFPSIVSPEQTNVGPAFINVLNCWLAYGDDSALVEFVDGKNNIEVQDIKKFYGMRQITPGTGIYTPSWSVTAENLDYGEIEPGGTAYTYEVTTGVYFVETAGELVPMRPEGKAKPFTFIIKIQDVGNERIISAVTPWYRGSDLDANGQYKYNQN